MGIKNIDVDVHIFVTPYPFRFRLSSMYKVECAAGYEMVPDVSSIYKGGFHSGR